MARNRGPLPLTSEHIAAATRLHEQYLPQWSAADAALEAVRGAFSDDFSYAPNLVRVATVKTLYGTNLKAVHPMAEHIAGILPGGARWLSPIELVEAIAALPPAGTANAASNSRKSGLKPTKVGRSAFMQPHRHPKSRRTALSHARLPIASIRSRNCPKPKSP
jgi:hypothetical protein